MIILRKKMKWELKTMERERSKTGRTKLCSNIIQTDVVVECRVGVIGVAGKELVTEQTQTLLFSADLFLPFLSKLRVLWVKRK